MSAAQDLALWGNFIKRPLHNPGQGEQKVPVSALFPRDKAYASTVGNVDPSATVLALDPTPAYF